MKKTVTAFVAALGLLCCMTAPSLAQIWPQKPIRMIVPFPAGGGTDFVGTAGGRLFIEAAEPADLRREPRRCERRRSASKR